MRRAASLIGFTLAHHLVYFVLSMGFLTLFISAFPSLLDSFTLSYLQRGSGQYGRFRLWGSIGYGIGGLIATALTLRLPLGSIFITAALILAAGTVITLRIAPGSQTHADQRDNGQAAPYRLFSVQFLLFLLMAVLLQVANSFYGSFFGIYIHDLGGDQSYIGMAIMISAVCELPFFYYASAVVGRWGPLRTLAVAGLFYALRWLWLGLIPHTYTALLTQSLHGATFCLYYAAAMEYIARSVPKQARTTAISVFTAVTALASIAGNLMNGYLYDRTGLLTSPYTAAGFALLAALGYWLMSLRSRRTAAAGAFREKGI
ncbi:MFS transporter [Paenibacillus sp. P26]|nr:MFS transporter [Paenibacillus sp. P26]